MEYRFTEICHVARDYEKAIGHWKKVVGAGPFYLFRSDALRDPVYRGGPAEDRFIAALGFSGDTLIEFVQPLNDAPSIYQEVLRNRGDLAVHHIDPCIRPLDAEEFDAQCAAYAAAAYEPALNFRIKGIGRNTFFDATRDFGLFFEVLEIDEANYAMVKRMHRSHLEWDGPQPTRDFSDLASEI